MHTAYYTKAMDTTPVIVIDRLSKQYVKDGPYALKDLSITVNKGEVYGFLGPNGAGKSTLIRTLLNFIQPTSGSATILGNNIVKDTVTIRKSLGYLSGDFASYEKMTGKQFLEFMSALQPLKRKSAIIDLSKTFKVNLNKRIRDLSKGNRQKIGIIQAFMHDPEILILDEPTDGLDPLMQEAFYSLVRTAQSKGTTVLVSSHNLTEVQKMCDRVGIIRDGKLVSENTIADLIAKAAQTFDVTFKDAVPLSAIKTINGIKRVTSTGLNSVSFHVQGDLSPALNFLARHHVVHLSTRELNLEDEFMKYYETRRAQ